MKIKALLIALLIGSSLSAQKIKVETGETGKKTEDRPVISKILNNTVYVATVEDNKATVIGFDKTTLKQKSSFTTEKIKFIALNGFLFLENKVIVLYKNKSEAPLLGDVYDYNGKSISKGIALTTFDYHDNYGYSTGDCMVSENGKYFMIARSNLDDKAVFDYAMYDSDLKSVGKGNVKLPKDHSNDEIEKLLLSNTGNIGILSSSKKESTGFNLFRYVKASKAIEEVKEFSNEYFIHYFKHIVTKNGFFLGGIYGKHYIKKVKFSGEYNEKLIQGAFAMQLNLDDFSVVYSNLTDFSDDQAAAYNEEISKHPNYTKFLEKATTPEGKIHNEYLRLNLDAMTLDKNNNIVLAISSFNGVSETQKFATNVAICQFKLKKEGGISNFKIIPKRNSSYNDPMEGAFRNSEYFYSSLVCSGDCIISLFNDHEKNINNLTDMNKNESAGNKSSLLASAEVQNDGSFKKFKSLPNDEDVLILTYCTMYIDETLSFAIATRDKGEVVLLKISVL